jgi:uracil-DNA glycosylase family 4
LSELRAAYLAALGIPVWVRRDQPEVTTAAAAPPLEPPPLETAVPAKIDSAAPGAMSWDALAEAVAGCERCPLHGSRTRTVFGVGRRDADLLIVGEAPGADEDRQGEPFVGRAGQLLNAMLAAIGLARGDVYIANVLKCRPPGNRDPKPDEAAACTPYLERQIALLQPQVVLAVGRIAAQWLLQSEQPIGRLRATVHSYGTQGIPLVASYHPAYLLRSPLAKAKAWEDLLLVRKVLRASA